MKAAYCRTCDSEDCRCDRPGGPIDVAVKALRALEDPDFVETSSNGEHPFVSHPPDTRATVQPPPDIAHDLRILDKFVEEIHGCGVVGEDRTAKLVYLGITSRLLDEPVSEAIKGLSSSGKSHVVDQTIRFFPETAYIEMTAMSERALIYEERDFAHRTIVLFEAVALREQREKTESNLTAYFVRSLLSEGRIRYPVTVRKKDGGHVTKVIEKNGPTNLILSTTATSLHGENETRMISLPTNDSTEQTRAVLVETARQRLHRTGKPDLSQWRQFQTWLETAEHRVFIPYVDILAENIPPVAVRLRRDFKAILGLIEAHAILHQANRERDDEWIVASWDDYAVVRELVIDLISDGVGATVSDTVRETVATVAALTVDDDKGVTAARVATVLGLEKSAAYRRLQVARERGYIVNQEERRGRPGRYVAGDPMPEKVDLLPQPHNQDHHKPAGLPSGCTVAEVAEGRETPPGGTVASASEGVKGDVPHRKIEWGPRVNCSVCREHLTFARVSSHPVCPKCLAGGGA